MALQRAVRRLRARQAASEDGFTLIEVVVATSILFVVMASIAYLGTIAFADVAMARVRQTGTALANQALEQVRALPYDTVALGHNDSDLTGDPAITFDGTSYRFDGEILAHAPGAAAAAPIVPNTGTQVIDDITYTVKTYVTHYEDNLTSGAFRVTAIVTWIASLRPGALNEAQVQTVLHSPTSNTSCQSTATHPYPAPCQAKFFGDAVASPGGMRFTPATSTLPIIEGNLMQEAVLSVPVAHASVDAEAVPVINAASTLSGASYRMPSADPVRTGYTRWQAQADGDAGTPVLHYQRQPDPAPAAPVASNLTISGSNSTSLTVATGGGDTGQATAAASATMASPCADAVAVPITNGFPCGTGTTTQATTNRVTLGVPAVGSMRLASIDGGTTAAHVSRTVTPTTACPNAATEGCVVAVKRQTISSVRLGGLPTGFIPLAAGFLDSLVRIDNLTTTVTAAAGIGSADPTVTRSGTLSYFNGALGGYTTVDLATSGGIALPPLVLDLNGLTTGIRVRMVADLRVGDTSAPACAAPCEQSEAFARSALLGTITYTVSSGSNVIANTAIDIDLGTLTATASYKPSA